MLIRAATTDDWPAIWSFMHRVLATGETLCLDPEAGSDWTRTAWLHEPPGRTVVAVDPDGTILGTAETHPNQRGPGAHIANAGFVVDPAHSGRGIGRALGEHVIAQARDDGYHAMQFNAVVETNTHAVALWRSLGFEVLATIPEAFRHPTKGYVGLNVMHRRL